MSSSSEESSDSMGFTPPGIILKAKIAKENLLPPKSKERYKLAYEKFIQWKTERRSKSLSENVFLAYFSDLAKTMKPTTLWSIYSMLKSTVLLKHNINIKDYHNLTGMLKRQSDGYKCKKSKVLTRLNVETFINEAPDSEYLAVKVALICGIYGACRCMEIVNITVNDIETHDNVMLITLRDTKNKTNRTFMLRDILFALVQKYQALRPVDVQTNRLFLNYRNCKCTKQVMGRHKIAQMPKMIAIYLNIPNPEEYTGHCFRRSSATLLADTGANLITLKRHGGWKSDRVAESYIEESVENKCKITNQISKTMNLRPSTSHQEASTSAQAPRPSTAGELKMYGEESIQQLNTAPQMFDEEIIQQQDPIPEMTVFEKELIQIPNAAPTPVLTQTSVSNINPGKAVLNFSNCTFTNCNFY